MILPLHARIAAASVLATALACGGGGGGGDQSFTDPGHQASALDAEKLSGIGDSIMQGVDAAGSGPSDFGDQLAHSFAQGTSHGVFSVYSRYQVVSGLAGGEEFESVSGAEMIGRPEGIPNAVDQATFICGQTALPNRVVVLLGANDVCDSEDVASLPTAADFGAALTDALDELGSCLDSGSKVHVLSIPRLDLLYQAVAGKTESYFHESCPQFWTDFMICPIVTGASAADVGTRITAYNDAILAAVNAAEDAYEPIVEFTTDWTGAGGTSIGTYVFTAADVSSLDCFHPSVEGQAKLACGAWESWEGLGNASACF